MWWSFNRYGSADRSSMAGKLRFRGGPLKTGININNLAIATGVASLLWPSTIWRALYVILLFCLLFMACLFLFALLKINKIPDGFVFKRLTAELSHLLVLPLVGWGGGLFTFAVSVVTALVAILTSRKLLSLRGIVET